MRTTASYFSSDHITNPNTFIKILTISFLTLSLFFTVKHFSDTTYTQQLSLPFTLTTNTSNSFNSTAISPPPPPPSPPPPPPPLPPPEDVVERTGIVDENGAMTDDFVVGDYDSSLLENAGNESLLDKGGEREHDWGRIGKFRVCDESKREYIPCLDNVEVVSRLNSTEKGENYERHCPSKDKELDCLVPNPKRYKNHIPWPQSRDEVF